MRVQDPALGFQTQCRRNVASGSPAACFRSHNWPAENKLVRQAAGLLMGDESHISALGFRSVLGQTSSKIMLDSKSQLPSGQRSLVLTDMY